MLQLNYNEFETVLAKDKVTFPDNESVWMKDMSCLLNVRLDKVQDEGPVFEEKPIGMLPILYLLFYIFHPRILGIIFISLLTFCFCTWSSVDLFYMSICVSFPFQPFLSLKALTDYPITREPCSPASFTEINNWFIFSNRSINAGKN